MHLIKEIIIILADNLKRKEVIYSTCFHRVRSAAFYHLRRKPPLDLTFLLKQSRYFSLFTKLVDIDKKGWASISKTDEVKV